MASPSSAPGDRLQRPLRDLRLSVTDRCNLRCTYCMPQDALRDRAFIPRSELLSFEELTRITALFTSLGVTKVRLTGGEPLLRHDLPRLVAMLRALPSISDLALTTNALLLPRLAPALRSAGLTRVTISLDSLDDDVFGRLNGRSVPVGAVLDGLSAAEEAGFGPIKINVVIQRGINDHEVLPIARRFRGSGHIVRFIEFMDAGNHNGWKLDRVLPAAEVIRRIHAEMPLEAVAPSYPGEVASRWRYRSGGGEIGVITSVTSPFCRTCSRARLSARGELFTCLFAHRGYDLRAPLRAGAGDAELRALLARLWGGREDRYSELRSQLTRNLPPRVEMSYIGG